MGRLGHQPRRVTMAKKTPRPEPSITQDLSPLRADCPHCGQATWADYANRRTVATLAGLTRLNIAVRRCHNRDCQAHLRPLRPEAEGRVALPRHEFGLDVVALAGTLRYREHKSVPEIHRDLLGRGLAVSQRSVTNLLDRYDELLAVALADDARLNRLLDEQGKVVRALDALQPAVGHEVLWVLRDCLSGEILLARSLLSARQQDLAELLGEVRDALAVPVAAVVSDGQRSIRKAVAEALPGVPHQLCHFPYLRQPAPPPRRARGGRRPRGAGPQRQEAPEEAGPRRPQDRARLRGRRGRGGGGDPRLLLCGAQCPARRRPAAAGRLRAEVARAAHRRL